MTAVNIGGIFTLTDSRAQLVERAVADCRSARADRTLGAKLVFDNNGHGLALYHRNRQFRDAIDAADLVHADGGFIVAAAARLAGAKIAERSATTDMISDLARRFEAEELSFYLLGGTETANAAAAAALLAAFPRLKITGRHHGYFAQADEATIVENINAASPDVLWVGLGKPREQTFAATHRAALKCGWVVTCGGCFDFLSGRNARAPQWMQNNALEWLHRLATNPQRLFWRYSWTNPYAAYLALRYSTEEIRDA